MWHLVDFKLLHNLLSDFFMDVHLDHLHNVKGAIQLKIDPVVNHSVLTYEGKGSFEESGYQE